MKTLITFLIMTLAGSTYAEDMQKYLRTTQELAAQGNNEEALERFLWFHEHALEHDQAMYGVRLSFALSYWKSLGDSYPPALEAMVKIRDGNAELLRGGKGNRDLFHDTMALNRTLGEPEKTVALFESMIKENPALGEEYWSIAKDPVLEQKRYDLARTYLKDVVVEFDEVKDTYERHMALSENLPTGGADLKKHAENSFVADVLQLIELALALDDQEAATRVRESALAVVDDERLKGETGVKPGGQ